MTDKVWITDKEDYKIPHGFILKWVKYWDEPKNSVHLRPYYTCLISKPASYSYIMGRFIIGKGDTKQKSINDAINQIC